MKVKDVPKLVLKEMGFPQDVIDRGCAITPLQENQFGNQDVEGVQLEILKEDFRKLLSMSRSELKSLLDQSDATLKRIDSKN